MRLHPAGHTSLIEIFKRPAVTGRPGSRALENIFQIMVLVAVQPADGQGLFGALELSAFKTVFAARVSSQRQADIRPQLPLGAKTMGRLQDRYEHSGADGTTGGNPPERLHSGVLAAFHQQFVPGLQTQPRQGVELLIVEFHQAVHPLFREFRQPFRPMTRRIHLLADTGNPLTPVDRFCPCHHPGQIPRDRQMSACQFPQRTKTRFAVVHRRELVPVLQQASARKPRAYSNPIGSYGT